MEKVVHKSLKMTIIQEITQLNRSNVQFYALLRKLEQFNQLNGQTVNQRLQSIRLDIRQKIRSLASNVDMLYQTFDKKIGLIVGFVNQLTGKDSNKLQQQIFILQGRIKELQQKNNFLSSKYENVANLNEQLKKKNLLMSQQIDALSKRGVTMTNDSNQSDNKSRDYLKKEHEDTVSLQNRLASNDLTFNQKNDKRYKTIRSEQNSFSSVLIREQNSFQPNIKPSDSSSRLVFGCLPKKREQIKQQPSSYKQKNNTNIGIKCVKNQQKNHNSNLNDQPSYHGHGQSQNHRMQFLINNLRQAHETTLTSQRSFLRNQEQQKLKQKSVLSKDVVKKYMI